MSTNILYTAAGRRIEFDLPDKALETAEELMGQGAGLDIAVTHTAPIVAAAELARLHTFLEKKLQEAQTDLSGDHYEAGFITGLDEARKLVQSRIAELGGV